MKWRVFKEKLPQSMQPMWVVWDDHGEFLFPTGVEALSFVDEELKRRRLGNLISMRQENLYG